MIPTTILRLRDEILTAARARGVPLEERALDMEQDLPVLRLRLGRVALRGARVRLPGTRGPYAPDVITVQGSGFRDSRMWPRRRDGTFNIEAVVDHLLAAVHEELSQRRPLPVIAVGVPTAASGLHVLRQRPGPCGN